MEDKRTQKDGLNLLAKGKKGVIHMVFSRFGIVLVLLALQILFLLGIFIWFRNLAPHYLVASVIFYLTMIVVLVNSHYDATAKITWLVIMMLFPILGALLYIFTNVEIGHRALKKRTIQIIEDTKHSILQNQEVYNEIKISNPEMTELSHYINRTGCFPVYSDTDVTYYPLGEQMFEAMLEELEQAKDFIFMEYFILDEGMMWGRILEILARKAKDGVDVRVMYDGTCEFALLPRSYPKQLEELGIKCKVFAPIAPFISTHYNYRDHRKILVVDGKVAFNGGINLADEYINHIRKYGHWKDTGVMLKGTAVASFTLMFLQMWHINEKMSDFSCYINPTFTRTNDTPISAHSKGYVMPYGECPLDNDNVAEFVYIDMLNRAHDYVHITTPYMILDGELENAIKFAAKRGVDVTLILPHISDSFVAHSLAKTYYRSLIEAGVRIYEYTPGFIHAKVFVSDNIKAIVGTINLDYRSLYHHFECGTYLYDTDCIKDIENDFQDTLGKSQPVTLEDLKKENVFVKIVGNAMKLIAPLL